MLGNIRNVNNSAISSHNKNLHIYLTPKNDLPDESFNNILKIYANVVDNDTENDAELDKDQKKNQFKSITFGTLGTIETDHFERDFANRKRTLKDFYELAFQEIKMERESRDRMMAEIENVFKSEQVHSKREKTVSTSGSGTSYIPDEIENFISQRGNVGVTSTRYALQPLDNFDRSAST